MALVLKTLDSFLNDEEKNQMSTEILDKLNNEYISKVELCSKLNIEIEKYKTDFEQQKFILEKEINSIQEKFEEEGRLRVEAKLQRDTIESKLNEQNELVQKLNEKVQSLTRQLERCQTEQETASSQSTTMAGSLESKTKLVEELKDQVTALEEYLSKSQKAKCDAMIQSEEASALQIQFQFKERKFEQEKSLRSRQLSILQQQLEERAEEILRRDNSNSILSLQSEIAHHTQEINILREEKESFQKILTEKTEKNQELFSTLNDMRMSEARLDETFRLELSAQKKIATIYEASSDDQNKRCEELEMGIEELRQLLRESSEQYGALSKAKEKVEEEAQNSLTQTGQLNKDLQDELNKINELMKISKNKDNIMSSAFPTASAASQLDSKGLTLSQLYVENLNTSEKLYKSDDENKRLKRHIEQILEEIHEKAPYLELQRDDYGRALETIDALHSQIEDCILELEKEKLESEESKRRAGFIGCENDRLSQQVKDLSKQVSVLITQVEAARAGLPPPSLSVLDTYNEMSTSDIIDPRLVSFRNVSELQEQNQKLLASLRELAEKLETSESDVINSKVEQLNQELETAKKELSELRFSREKMQSIADNVLSQRDMYRTIVNEQGNMTNGKCHSDEPIQNKAEYQKIQQELDVAKKEAAKYKKEHEVYREERNKNEQLEKSEHDRIKTSYDKTKSENIRLLSHAEFNVERLKTLQNNCESYERQIVAVEDKNGTLQTIIGRHESAIENFRQNILSLTKRLANAEVQASSLRDEKFLLKESESHLLVERDSLHRSRYSHSILLSNLESIQNNLDRTDSETKIRNENKIADLTDQCSRLKAKIEANTDLKEASLNIVSLTELMRLSKVETEALKKSLTETESQLSTLRQQVQDRIPRGGSSPILNRQRMVSPQSTPMRSSPMAAQSVRDFQIQLSEEKAKSESLLASVDRSKISEENLKKMIEELEKQLECSNVSNTSGEEKNTSLTKNLEEALKNIQELKQKLSNAEESEVALREMKDHQLLKMTEELEERENESEEAHRKVSELTKSEDTCKNAMREKIKLAEKMQDKYEKEVMLHGADLQVLASLKQSVSTYDDQIESLTVEKLKAQEVIEDTKCAFEKHKSDLMALNESLKTRETELEEQNKSILDKFMTLSDKMAVIQTKLSGDAFNASFTEDEIRSSDQLKEVIKYLRREKELASEKRHEAEEEAQRLEIQKETIKNKVTLLEKQLNEEHQKNQSASGSAGQYHEIMRKVNTTEALTDSNKLMRDEKTKLEKSIIDLKSGNDALQSEINPLLENKRTMETQIRSLTTISTALEEEKEKLKKRVHELVERINKTRPEDMIELQKKLSETKLSLEKKETEYNRLKNSMNGLSKNHQTVLQHRNQVQQQLVVSREEHKTATEENQKSSREKVRLHQQVEIYMEKTKGQEKTILKNEEILTLSKNQLSDSLKKEEQRKKEFDIVKHNKELQEKQIIQIRKVAMKYKKLSEEHSKTEVTDKEIIQKLEDERDVLLQQVENKSLETEQLKETITNHEAEINRRDQLPTITSEQGTSSDATTDDQRIQQLQNQLAEYEGGKNNPEKYILENESLNKKLQMQQKIMEKLQKQSCSVCMSSKSPSTATEKPSSDPPPTANIKPMAAPVPTASPRCPTPIGSRSIPTASVRPMAPSVVLMPILDTHDGAVSSTVTLPQATFNPTPVVSTCTLTQATLTATISPMTSVAPQTSTLDPEEMSGPSTSAGGATTSDDLISEALAAITAPEERGGQKRKLEVTEDDEEDEEYKRVRTMEEEEEDEDVVVMEGEPSSSCHRSEVEEEQQVMEEENEMELTSGEDDSEVPQQSEAEMAASSSAAVEQSAFQPLGVEVPSSHPEPSTTSRQSLAPFAAQYEEDDRTVPSTPTLFVPRPCEGAAGVSTPQVPTQGGPFEFGSQNSSETSHSNEGLSQIADGGNIDVTRMDLSQLEQRSPAVEGNVEGNISSSAGESDVVQQAIVSVLNEAEADAPVEEIIVDEEDDMSGSEQLVVSSQAEDTLISHDEIEVEEIEEEEEIEEHIEETLEEEQEEDISEEMAASSVEEPVIDAPRTRHTAIVPIVFDEATLPAPVRGDSRGRRRGSNFRSPLNYQPARGSQRARRSYSTRGGAHQ